MITVSLLTQPDADVLKCVYFQLVKTLKEIDWYGLDCNREEYIQNIETSFTYLQIIDMGCTLTHQLQCSIKNFITKMSSFCVFTSDKCTTKTIQITPFLLTEASEFILTESGDYILT